MGCATPLVGTKVSGVEDYCVGELVDVDDHIGLAEGILKILNMSDSEYSAKSEEAFQVAQKYSWEGNFEKRFEFYQRKK